MKTVLALLAVVVVAQAAVPSFQQGSGLLSDTIQAILDRPNHSLENAMKLSDQDMLAWVRKHCPLMNGLSDKEVVDNTRTNINNAKNSPVNFLKGFNCRTVMSKQSHLDGLTAVPPTNRPEGAAPTRQKRQAVPASVDWRTKGYVNAVKNQGQCGSCWTFSANGAMEGAIFKKTGKLPNLSEQNLVDCVTASSGCNGGWMTDAYDYSIKNGGVDNQTSYAYIAKQNPTCKYIASGNAGKVASYAYTIQDDETDLKNKLATVGPIAIAIDATYIQNYVSGIVTCPNFQGVNHGVLLVGYGTDASGADYWIVRNSWGPTWGEQGYLRIARGTKQCGVATYANYPVA